MYEFDLSQITIDDVLRLQPGKCDPDEFVQFLHRVTIGGVLHLPFWEMSKVVAAFGEAMNDATGQSALDEIDETAAAAWGEE